MIHQKLLTKKSIQLNHKLLIPYSLYYIEDSQSKFLLLGYHKIQKMTIQKNALCFYILRCLFVIRYIIKKIDLHFFCQQEKIIICNIIRINADAI